MFKLTVDSVVELFTEVLKKLDLVIEMHNRKAGTKSDKIEDLKQEVDEHFSEIARAQKIKENLSKLLEI